MPVLNRAAVILRYREPAVRWINQADPDVDGPEIGLKAANEEATVHLISDEDGDGPNAVNQWLKGNYQELFESELEEWYSDPELWPADRTLELFRAWFDVECHSVIVDTVGGQIYDDED